MGETPGDSDSPAESPGGGEQPEGSDTDKSDTDKEDGGWGHGGDYCPLPPTEPEDTPEQSLPTELPTSPDEDQGSSPSYPAAPTYEDTDLDDEGWSWAGGDDEGPDWRRH